MENGLGVLGWGVGGIEAEAAMLGQPVSMLIPRVVGFKLTGEIKPGVTATDVVLTVTDMLRKHGVVGKFVEFYGKGVAEVPLANRATLGNMSPEFGSTAAIFPIDEETINYLRLTGRTEEQLALVEAYAKTQGMWHDAGPRSRPSPSTSSWTCPTVVPSISGPKRPQDRIELSDAKNAFRKDIHNYVEENLADAGDQARRGRRRVLPGQRLRLACPSPTTVPSTPARRPPTVPRAGRPSRSPCAPRSAATSCSTTARSSSPASPPAPTPPTRRSCSARALLAKKAVEKGLTSKPWVKTNMAPGSPGRHRLLQQGQPVALPGEAGLLPGRLRLHHLHRQHRPAARRDLGGHQRQRPVGDRGALR